MLLITLWSIYCDAEPFRDICVYLWYNCWQFYGLMYIFLRLYDFMTIHIFENRSRYSTYACSKTYNEVHTHYILSDMLIVQWDAIHYNHKYNNLLLWSRTGSLQRPFPLWNSHEQKQGKSKGFDSCDWPSILTHTGFKSSDFSDRVTLKFHGLPRKTKGHLFYTTWSFGHPLEAIRELKLE